jgi:hypothetical protein
MLHDLVKGSTGSSPFGRLSLVVVCCTLKMYGSGISGGHFRWSMSGKEDVHSSLEEGRCA